MHRKQKAGLVPAFCFSARHGVRARCFVDFFFGRVFFRANRSSFSSGGRRVLVMPESDFFCQIVSATGMDPHRVPKYFREFDMLAVTNR
ncbi:hypothetical protein [Burkholderia cepacia]|uniref:hypothetical protein n=1 Tax=Burkholderia cepacia TaxID=292 RepID=UPI0021497DF4|nr:hypothetical protein [Burkholderia cepacia]